MTSTRYILLEPTGSSSANIGEGAYGEVYKAYDKQTGEMVALKKMKAGTDHDGVSTSTLREFALLNNLSHENVVKLIHVEIHIHKINLVFELVDHDLKKEMDMHQGYLNPELVESFSSQLLEGLSYCHCMGIMHRDIKPQNILISKGGNLKIADFGLARSFLPANRSLTPAMVTRWYRAPEILLGYSKYDCSVDLWSVACVIVEMSNKRALFAGDSEIDQIHKIFSVLGTPNNDQWSEMSSLPYWRNNYPDWVPLDAAAGGWRQLAPRLGREGADLISKLLVYSPQRRLTALGAVEHSYIAQFRQRQADKAAAAAALTSTTITASAAACSSDPQMIAFFTPPANNSTTAVTAAATGRGGLILPRGRPSSSSSSGGGLGIAEEELHQEGQEQQESDVIADLPFETAVGARVSGAKKPKNSKANASASNSSSSSSSGGGVVAAAAAPANRKRRVSEEPSQPPPPAAPSVSLCSSSSSAFSAVTSMNTTSTTTTTAATTTTSDATVTAVEVEEANNSSSNSGRRSSRRLQTDTTAATTATTSDAVPTSSSSGRSSRNRKSNS